MHSKTQQARHCLLAVLVLQANTLMLYSEKTKVGGYNEVAKAVQASRGRGVTKDLKAALEAGNSDLDAGLQIGKTYTTALHRAAKFGDVLVTEALLAAGASPEGTPPPGAEPRGVYWTPLHHAAALGKVGVCDALVAAGHSLNVRDGRGFDPLHMARVNENDVFNLWQRVVTAGTPVQLARLSLETLRERVAVAGLAPAAAADTEPADYAEHMAAIYREHAPEKQSSVPALLEKYSGREAELLETIRAKYGIKSGQVEKARLIRVISQFHGAQLVQEFEADLVAAAKDIAEQAADKAYVAKKAAMTPDELAQEDEKYEL